MEDQKLENLLNLALGATEEEREKSLNLDVGYHPIDREWELIIKYSGNLDQVRALAIQVVELQNEYAIIRISQSRIDLLSDIPEIEYIEKPKRLFFQIANGKRVSCINEVQDTRFLEAGGSENWYGIVAGKTGLPGDNIRTTSHGSLFKIFQNGTGDLQ